MKFARFQSGIMRVYEFSTYEEASQKFEVWKREFIEDNHVLRPVSDKFFRQYCEMLDDFLRKFKESKDGWK